MEISGGYIFYLVCSLAYLSAEQVYPRGQNGPPTLNLAETSTIVYTAHAQVEERICGGNYSVERQFPYQISLQTETRLHRCGGAIISERYVLTAAHCVLDNRKIFESSRFKVVADTTDVAQPRIGRAIDVEKIYVPKTYWEVAFKDDIAVLKLKQDIDLSNGLRKLYLPRVGQNYVGQVAKVTGYGWNKIRDRLNGSTDFKLKYLDVNIIANEKCQIEVGTIQTIYDSNICGQAVQQSNGIWHEAGICNGDSGGPLVIGNTVIGVVSLGTTRCIELLYHARYTRVSSFVRFIDNAMRGIRTTDMVVHHINGSDETKDAIAFPENKK